MSEAIVCGIFTLINLGILAISVKCLTEFYKVRELTKGGESRFGGSEGFCTEQVFKAPYYLQCIRHAGHSGDHVYAHIVGENQSC